MRRKHIQRRNFKEFSFQELMDDLHPSYEHLIANEVLPEQQDNNLNQETAEDKKQQQQDSQVPNQQNQQEEQESRAQQINAAVQEEKPSLELDEIANVSFHLFIIQRN